MSTQSDEKLIEVEADTLDEVKNQVKAQIPDGLVILAEQIIDDGKSHTVQATADTIEDAFAKAQGKIPNGKDIVEKKVIIAPETGKVNVQAFDERTAKWQAEAQKADTHTTVKSVRLTRPGSNGFLGIGKKPNEYEVETFLPATVEIVYKGKARMTAKVGKKRFVEDIVEDLRQLPPTNTLCYLVLFGDRPLTAKNPQQKTEEAILAFTQQNKADGFIRGYEQYYATTKPLSVLRVGETSKLWAMLNDPARDSLYKPPYGLVINFNYSGQPFNVYSRADLQRIGAEGLGKGLSMVK